MSWTAFPENPYESPRELQPRRRRKIWPGRFRDWIFNSVVLLFQLASIPYLGSYFGKIGLMVGLPAFVLVWTIPSLFRRKKIWGFRLLKMSLLEVAVVWAIIGLLLAILIPQTRVSHGRRRASSTTNSQPTTVDEQLATPIEHHATD